MLAEADRPPSSSVEPYGGLDHLPDRGLVRAGAQGQAPSALVSLDMLLFVACPLTHLASAAFAASCGRAGWLGRGAARADVILNLVTVPFIVLWGLAFPDPTAMSTPWYTRPGFVAGIPAVPWIMPCLQGVVLLRRAGRP